MERQQFRRQTPLHMLVLAGGESTRMGEDKSQIEYHGKSQELYLADLGDALELEVFMSKWKGHKTFTIGKYPVIKDRYKDHGPLGGIFSAFLHEDEAGWLVVACDMPLIDGELLQELIDGRNTEAYATAFMLPDSKYPEPLITIYEPRILPVLIDCMNKGMLSPKKLLMQVKVERVYVEDVSKFQNANTAEEKAAIMTSLQS